MGIHYHEPVPENVMLKTDHIGEHSICQTLRNIYCLCDNMKANNGHIKLQTRLAMSMAKAMNRKLKEYARITKGRDLETIIEEDE